MQKRDSDQAKETMAAEMFEGIAPIVTYPTHGVWFALVIVPAFFLGLSALLWLDDHYLQLKRKGASASIIKERIRARMTHNWSDPAMTGVAGTMGTMASMATSGVGGLSLARSPAPATAPGSKAGVIRLGAQHVELAGQYLERSTSEAV